MLNGLMQINDIPHDRRGFIRLAASVASGALLSACGGGSGQSGSGDAIVVVPAPTAAASPVMPVMTASHRLNLALNLAYLGGQFYGYAGRGRGLPGDLTTGIGQPGQATGARQASFGDAAVANYAVELADDKQAHVVALRAQMGVLAAAQPAIDLSTRSTSAFSLAAQGAGIVAAGASFDPYATDEYFLLGAFLVENAVAAAYRTLLAQGAEDAASAAITANLADAIYHAGLVRSLLDDKAVGDAAIDRALSNASTLLATIDGSNVGDQTLAGASGTSSNIPDAAGRPIPFTRETAQVLKGLYLSNSGIGGFLPSGANGVAL